MVKEQGEFLGGVFNADGVKFRINYGWYIMPCLPVGRSRLPSAACGMVVLTGTLQQKARDAGYYNLKGFPIKFYYPHFTGYYSSKVPNRQARLARQQ
jgi:hypothetical protein